MREGGRQGGRQGGNDYQRETLEAAKSRLAGWPLKARLVYCVHSLVRVCPPLLLWATVSECC